MRERLPPLQWLRSFEAAARHMSFTTAAEELLITQSAVSQQVKALEQYLGQPLFLRRARSLQLSDAGRNYLPVVREAFAVLTEGTQTFLGHDPQRVVEIKSNNAFGVYWLLPRLEAFLTAHPGFEIRLSTVLLDSDYTGGFGSVEIRFGRGDWAGAVKNKIADADLFPVCSPALARRLKEPRDLARERLLHLAGLRRDWDFWLEAAGCLGLKAREYHSFNTFVLTFNLAVQGFGVALAHDITAGGLLAEGKLVRPFDTAAPSGEAYYLIPPRQGDANEAAVAFCDWIMAEMVK